MCWLFKLYTTNFAFFITKLNVLCKVTIFMWLYVYNWFYDFVLPLLLLLLLLFFCILDSFIYVDDRVIVLLCTVHRIFFFSTYSMWVFFFFYSFGFLRTAAHFICINVRDALFSFLFLRGKVCVRNWAYYKRFLPRARFDTSTFSNFL